jgi:uncharacterized protein (DUF433 family)
MSDKPVSLRLPDRLKAEIAEIAQRTQRSLSSVITEMLEEALKMRRVHGIYFADEFLCREAKVGGTGLGVWEVIETYQSMDQDWARLREYFNWLDEWQLREALEYYQAYPEEINEQVQKNQSVTEEEIWTAHPFTRPGPVRHQGQHGAIADS